MDKKGIVFILLSLLFTSPLYSQQKDVYFYLSEGDALYEKGDYKNALTSYFQGLRKSPDHHSTLFKIGITYLASEDKALALSYLNKVYKLNPDVDSRILLYLAMAYQSSHKYAQAKHLYEHYRKSCPKKLWPEIDEKIQQCMVSHGLLSNPIDVIIENVGTNINSPFDDYGPIVSVDDDVMIFTSNRRTEEEAKLNVNSTAVYEDVYIVRKEDGSWGTPAKIGPVINSIRHDAAASMSPDGKTLFIYYSVNNGDLYSTTLNESNQWTEPAPLNRNINTVQFKETYASVSADGKRLFFASNRPGGRGGLDIYVSELDESGNWGRAINLGPEINTAGDEDSPFIHADGVTLYFSSNGHPGMGSSDIFKSEFRDGNWGKPQNMGYPLNSLEYDGFFTISRDKRTAYFATRRKYGAGEYDILKATYRNVYEEEPLPEIPVQQTPLASSDKPASKDKTAATTTTTATGTGNVVIAGKAIDKQTSSPLKAEITVVNKKNNKQVAKILADASGKYELPIKQSGEYVITAELDGYLYNSVNIKVADSDKARKIDTNFSMMKADVGSVMVLSNIFFDIGKADLKPTSLAELEKIRRLLLKNPQLRVQINGHTDNVGDDQVNKTLSLKRALAVVNHLALNGIEFERLSAKGFGAERPIASNDDEKDGRELNRRTEIEIIGSDVLGRAN